jgi:hypothetical protein
MLAMVELIQHVRLRGTKAAPEAQKLLRIEVLPTEYDHLVIEKHPQDGSERRFAHFPGQIRAGDLGAHGVAGTLRGQHDARAWAEDESQQYTAARQWAQRVRDPGENRELKTKP